MLFSLLSICFALPSMAHDGWSQTTSPIVEIGEVAYVELLFGNHSNDHASYRIEGNWNMDNTHVFVVNQAGNKVDISETIFYTGELTESNHAGINNYYVGSFSSQTPGIYIISVEGDTVFTSGGVASRTLRNAKSFTAVNDIPMLSFIQDFEGYDQQVSPDRLEFVPLFNPASVTTNQEVAFQLVLEGEPIADTEVALIQRSSSNDERFRTDEEGIIRFTTGAADYYLIRAMSAGEVGADAEYERLNYEATLTFTVQNGNGLSPEEVVEVLLAQSDQMTKENGIDGEEQEGQQEEEAEQPIVSNEEAGASNAYLFISIIVIFIIIITLTVIVGRRNKK